MKAIIRALKISLAILFLGNFSCLANAASKTINIEANKISVPAQVIIEKGDLLKIDASGQWSVNGRDFFGPEGSGQTAGATYQKSGAAVGCLLGRIGIGGEVFVVGTHFSQKAAQTGVLWLGINDKKNLLEYRDNKGSLSVSISTERTEESVDGDYQVEYLDNNMEIISGSQHTPIRFGDIAGKPFQIGEGEVILNQDMVAKIKQILPAVLHVKVDGLVIYLNDANKPADMPAKGLYNPRQRAFTIGTGGAMPLGNSGGVGLFFISGASATFSGSAGNISLAGKATMTIVAGSKDKAGGFTIALPFTGQKR